MIKIFWGGKGGELGGGSSEGCLKWVGGGGGIKVSFQNILKQGWVKAKVFVGAFEGVTTPAPSPENFNHTPSIAIVGRASVN